MLQRKAISWFVSPHAKQRAWERYGVKFSPKKWCDFCTTIQRGKYSFRLTKTTPGYARFVCYFQQTWFLVGCSTSGRNGVITTFLPIDSLTDADKTLLRSHNLCLHLEDNMQDVRMHLLSASMRQRMLAETQICPEELPKDFDQIDLLLKKIAK